MMNSLVTSPLFAFAVVATTALLIILLHLLRPRALRRAVSSTVVWVRVLAARRSYHAPWRWLLSLLLCLAIGTALSMALGRPDGLGGAQSRLVIVLDNSASMGTGTLDGRSRWLHAVDIARELIESVSVEIMLVDSTGRAPMAGFVHPSLALDDLAKFAPPGFGRVRTPVLAQSDDVQVHVISDGVSAIDVPDGAVMHSVFEPAVNVAITGLQTRPMQTDPLRVEAFVQVYNASPLARPVRLSLRGGDNLSISRDVQMQPGELFDASFDISEFEGGVLAAAAISAGDAYPLDDIAYTLVQAHRLQSVILVSTGNARLEDALRSLPGVALRVMRPEEWNGSVQADAFVFDRFAPAQTPSRGALLFRPEVTAWLGVRANAVASPQVSDWERGHPLLDGVAWDEVKVERASLMTTLPAGVLALINTDHGALLTANSDGRRWIAVGFSPQDSNISLQPALPVFLGNALRWLTQTDTVITVEPGSVRIPLTNAVVIDGSGERVESRPIPGATLFDARRPDIFTATGDRSRARIVAGISDPHESDVNTSRFAGATFDAVGVTSLKRIEPWFALVSLALLLLLIEWVAWARRVAV